MKGRIILGTRRSRLALIQTELVAGALAEAWPGLVIERREIVTEGDRDRNTPLAQTESLGIFTREIENRLLAGEIDLAVHSLKDLPVELPEGLMIAAAPKRADPRDALVFSCRGAPACAPSSRTPEAEEGGHIGPPLQKMKQGAVVGTSSPRRSAQLLAIRPDLVMKDLRGNVDTRLAKLARGEYDAIVAAKAALDRMEAAGIRVAPLEPEVMLPAPGQGALAVECREGDIEIERLAAAISDSATYLSTSAERMLLERLGGGCLLALGALAEVDADGVMRLRAAALSSDGRRSARADARGPADDYPCVVEECRRQLTAAGANDILSA